MTDCVYFDIASDAFLPRSLAVSETFFAADLTLSSMRTVSGCFLHSNFGAASSSALVTEIRNCGSPLAAAVNDTVPKGTALEYTHHE